MKKVLKLVITALLIVVIVAGGIVLYNKLSEKYSPDNSTTQTTSSQNDQTVPETVAHPATDFTVTDSKGKEVKLSSMKGKPTVVNFWATWCGYCVEEMPGFQKVYEKYGDKINFMMVNLTSSNGESKKLADSFISEKEFTFPVYFDTLNTVSLAYNVRSVPVTYFIDAKGNILSHREGMLSETDLISQLEKIS